MARDTINIVIRPKDEPLKEAVKLAAESKRMSVAAWMLRAADEKLERDSAEARIREAVQHAQDA